MGDGEKDRYSRIGVSGLTSGYNFRRARFDRVGGLLWYHSGVRRGIKSKTEEIKECGYVDLNPIINDLSSFKDVDKLQNKDNNMDESLDTQEDLLDPN